MQKSDIFWQTYLNLEKEAIEVSKYIFFTDEVLVNSKSGIIVQPCDTQIGTFSPYIADLLVRCCVQIEAISKELYFDNGGIKPRGDSTILFDEDCLKLIDMKWSTHNKTVLVVAPSFNFTKNENRILKPLKEAHKRQGTYWEKAYQAVKHDRYSSLHKGNVKSFLHALAALYLLNIYYRNVSWLSKYQDISKHDFSMGSSIFAVKPPVVEQLWYGNNPEFGESPYVVKYKDDEYQRIVEIQQKEDKALNDYWNAQPELCESSFVAQLKESIEKKKKDTGQLVICFNELSKYRLNKKIPHSLTFLERKELLIKSDEWKCWMSQHNNHLHPDELTEENIQKEIDTVGTLAGMDIMRNLQKLEWIPLAMINGMCKIFIEAES